MWIKILFVLFVIALSFGGNFHLFAITPRQFMTIVMFIVCSINYNIIKKGFNRIIGFYLFYLFLLYLSSLNDDNLNVFWRNLLSQHFVALVSFSAIIYYFHRFKNVDLIVSTLLICGILNMLVCYLQYIGDPLGFFLGYLFISNEDVSANRHMELLAEGNGVGYLLGMRGDAVHNGYFQMIMPFLLIYVHNKFRLAGKNEIISKILFVILLTLLIVVVLLIEERSCILFMLFIFVFYLLKLYKSFSARKKSVVFIVLFFGIVVLFSYIMPVLSDYLLNSRFADSDDSLRSSLLAKSFSFIKENLLLGGMKSFLKIAGYPPHNIFLNSFVEAGVFGFVISLIIYFSQISLGLKLTNISNHMLLGYAFLAYTLNSLLHNDSILSGDVLAWLLWAMIFSLYKYFNKEKRWIQTGKR